MDVGQGYYWLQILAKKLLSGGLSPDAYNIALNVVNTDIFNLKVGLPQEYKPGQPLPRQAYEVSTKITDDIRNLRVLTSLNADPATGLFFPPQPYAAFSTMRYNYSRMSREKVISKPNEITIMTDQDYNAALSSYISAPTYKKVIGCYLNGGWQINPVLPQIILTYLRFPVTPFMAYTIVNDEVVYNAAGSTQLDWPVTVHSDFFIALCNYFGINLRDAEFKQFIRERQTQGQ